jgi:hypothetical protein
MKITHLGYEITCEQRISWDGKITSNALKIRKPPVRDKKEEVLVDVWWDQKMQKGINHGIKLVEQHVRAQTINPGRG